MDRFVVRVPPKNPPENCKDLPKPCETEEPELTEAANGEVQRVLTSTEKETKRRGIYAKYSNEFQLKVKASSTTTVVVENI